MTGAELDSGNYDLWASEAQASGNPTWQSALGQVWDNLKSAGVAIITGTAAGAAAGATATTGGAASGAQAGQAAIFGVPLGLAAILAVILGIFVFRKLL